MVGGFRTKIMMLVSQEVGVLRDKDVAKHNAVVSCLDDLGSHIKVLANTAQSDGSP